MGISVISWLFHGRFFVNFEPSRLQQSIRRWASRCEDENPRKVCLGVAFYALQLLKIVIPPKVVNISAISWRYCIIQRRTQIWCGQNEFSWKRDWSSHCKRRVANKIRKGAGGEGGEGGWHTEAKSQCHDSRINRSRLTLNDQENALSTTIYIDGKPNMNVNHVLGFPHWVSLSMIILVEGNTCKYPTLGR